MFFSQVLKETLYFSWTIQIMIKPSKISQNTEIHKYGQINTSIKIKQVHYSTVDENTWINKAIFFKQYIQKQSYWNKVTIIVTWKLNTQSLKISLSLFSNNDLMLKYLLTKCEKKA